MAQCTASLSWWQTPLHSNLVNPSLSLRSFFCRNSCEEIGQLFNCNAENPSSKTLLAQQCILYFRDDDYPLVEKRWQNVNYRTLSNKGIGFGPWAASMLEKNCRDDDSEKQSTGGPNGGGNDKDDDDGGGGGGGDDDSDDRLFFLPLLTLALAAFHMGYCISVWIKDDKSDTEFLRTGLGLFCLLVLAAIRLGRHNGIDAYILGLGSSVGVMVWAGERCIIKQEINPAGIVALCAASIGMMFAAALYHNI